MYKHNLVFGCHVKKNRAVLLFINWEPQNCFLSLDACLYTHFGVQFLTKLL